MSQLRLVAVITTVLIVVLSQVAFALVNLGKKMQRSQRMICQLYSGHRGAGKSTELLRLKRDLEKHKFWVVYFPADLEDIDSEDAQYTDILLACTRHLLERCRLRRVTITNQD